MKNLILITCLFIACTTKAQTTKPIDGFLGIKFGSTAAQVTQALKAKGAVIDKHESDEHSLTFINAPVNGRFLKTTFVYFANDKAYEAALLIIPESQSKSIAQYNKMVAEINRTYGIKASVVKTFNPPYTEGDGHEFAAIKNEKANYITTWTSNGNSIELSFKVFKSEGIMISLIYDSPAVRQ